MNGKFKNKLKKLKSLIESARTIEIIDESYPSGCFTVTVDKVEFVFPVESEEDIDAVNYVIDNVWDYLYSKLVKEALQFFPENEVENFEFDDYSEGIYVYLKSGEVYYVRFGESWETRITGYQASGIQYDFTTIRITRVTELM